MVYADLVDRLGCDTAERTVTAFPDGSVDTYYTLNDRDGERIDDNETFAERLTESPPAFPVERESTEPGGQAINMALQSDALGDRVKLFGHLDDPVFEGLGFEATSMGAPSRINIYPLDEDVIFAEMSEDLTDWTFEDFRTVVDRPYERMAVDAVCCGNWASAPGLTEAFRELAAAPIDGEVFVLDPGPITIKPEEAITGLFDALGDLESTYEVVVSLNRTELAAAARALGHSGDDERDRLAGLRATTGITATVLHAESEAVTATPDGVVTVPNCTVEEPKRETGAGDRFTAGLAYALVRGWNWEATLALGNACASYYVETARTVDRAVLRSWLE